MNWTAAKDFTSPDGKLVVRVSRSDDLPSRPLFSVQMGKAQDEGNVSRHIPIYFEQGRVKSIASILSALLAEAEAYIEAEKVKAPKAESVSRGADGGKNGGGPRRSGRESKRTGTHGRTQDD
jgi:hypothetical protein